MKIARNVDFQRFLTTKKRRRRDLKILLVPNPHIKSTFVEGLITKVIKK